MSFLSLLVYIFLQIIFIPLVIVGGLMVAYTQLRVSKKLGISQTAIEVLNGRWAMHVFGIREDAAAKRLAAVLPNTSVTGLWLCLIPLWIKYKISGAYSIYPRIPEPGSETLADLIVTRTLYFDRILDRVSDDVEQFVILGAGYDTRAYGNLKRDGLNFFEVDQVAVQNHKRTSLESAGISSDHVQFISVDFSNESTFDKLLAAGYDPDKKTLFLWEGVTLYLSENNVRRMLKDIRDNSVEGSTLVVDIYSDWFVEKMSSGAAKKLLEFTDEELQFGLDFSDKNNGALSSLAKTESMSVGEVFPMGSNREKGAFVAIVELNWN